MCQILFRRDNHKVPKIKNINIDNVNLVESSFYSDSIGIHNLELTKKIIDECGWENQLHEARVLTPASNKLGIKKYVLDFKKGFGISLLFITYMLVKIIDKAHGKYEGFY